MSYNCRQRCACERDRVRERETERERQRERVCVCVCVHVCEEYSSLSLGLQPNVLVCTISCNCGSFSPKHFAVRDVPCVYFHPITACCVCLFCDTFVRARRTESFVETYRSQRSSGLVLSSSQTRGRLTDFGPRGADRSRRSLSRESVWAAPQGMRRVTRSTAEHHVHCIVGSAAPTQLFFFGGGQSLSQKSGSQWMQCAFRVPFLVSGGPTSCWRRVFSTPAGGSHLVTRFTTTCSWWVITSEFREAKQCALDTRKQLVHTLVWTRGCYVLR